MSTNVSSRTVVYPDSDGLPMSDNTLQFQWLMTLVGGFQAIFRDNPDVFVAGDLLWYPVEGDNTIRSAPDAMVAFGRPKGYRGSYIQFREGGVAPQVVFEVRSPGNRPGELTRKRAFYQRYGVEEYYLIEPGKMDSKKRPDVEGWSRLGDRLQKIDDIDRWVSPRLGIRFDRSDDDLRVLGPNGRPLENYEDLAFRADEERERADEERERAERLAAKLRALGIDPDV